MPRACRIDPMNSRFDKEFFGKKESRLTHRDGLKVRKSQILRL